MMQDTPASKCDIVIIGAGMAGLSFAARLASAGFSIVIVDRQWPSSPEQWGDGFDLRVSALTLESQRFLTQVGAWERMQQCRLSPYGHMTVWDGAGTGCIDFDALESGLTHLGTLVENRVTTDALYRVLQGFENVGFVSDDFQSHDTLIDNVSVRLQSGRTLSASLLVGADGAQSRVRDAAGVGVRRWSYFQKAVVTTLECEKPHANTAWQVFTADGPLALLPLRHETDDDASAICSIVWSQNDTVADQLQLLDDAAFCEKLAATFEYRLGHVRLLDRRVQFPLQQQHAIDYIAPHVALIGDAAHTIHPLAGQGINLGFKDAAALAAVLLDARKSGLPLHTPSLLRRYQRQRKADNLAMMAAMEAFKRLYGTVPWPLQLARNWGMGQLDRHAYLKQWVVGQAVGI